MRAKHVQADIIILNVKFAYIYTVPGHGGVYLILHGSVEKISRDSRTTKTTSVVVGSTCIIYHFILQHDVIGFYNL